MGLTVEPTAEESTAVSKVDLGEKISCSSCGTRFFDLKKTPALCPKCVTENERPKTFRAKKADTPAPKPANKSPAPPAKKEGDADAIDALDSLDSTGDDDEDLIDNATDLDDDDDDDDIVIGPIDSDKDTNT